MLKIKRIGNIEIDQNVKVVQNRLYNMVDTEYYSEKKHKWPSNNIEFNFSGKNLYGEVNGIEFYISGKHKLFREKFDDIEIKGKFIENNGKTKVEYEVSSKPGTIVSLIIVNLCLIIILLILPAASGLDSAKMIGYIGIPVFLLLLDTWFPFDLKRKLERGEIILKEIITTP